MENTPKHTLPYIMAAQAQKHVTHNEALRALDALIQLSVKSRTEAIPPADPQEGDAYLVTANGQGDWLEHDGWFAAYQDGAWAFHRPKPGWLVWVEDESQLLVHGTDEFHELFDLLVGGIKTLQNLTLLGVNATADASNPFAVAAGKCLFNHAGSDQRIVINKASEGNTASLVFQDNWSGRAEFGLAGEDDFSIKVSADGSTFLTALRVDRTTGIVSLPQADFATGTAINLLPDSGRMGSGGDGIAVSGFQFPSYFETHNSAATAAAGQFINDNSDYGGASGTLSGYIRELTDKIKHASNRRYGLEYWACEVTAGSGTGDAVIVDNQTYYRALGAKPGPGLATHTFHCHVKAIDNSVVIARSVAGMTLFINGVQPAEDAIIDATDGWVSVMIRWQFTAWEHDGHVPPYFDVHCGQAGDRFLFACPALLAGRHSLGPKQGVLVSDQLVEFGP